MKYWTPKKILAADAQYNMVIGQRSNGKTYAIEKYGIEQYYKHHKQTAILRRFSEDFTGKRGAAMFDALVSNGEITSITGGEWTGVYYYGSRWYLCRYEDDTRVTDEVPFAYGFSISAMEHDKSTSYPNITTILFDEFLTRSIYLPDEFVLFQNVISTIKRQRTDVKIFMLGNTVTKYCPYFAEMGLKHVKAQKQGTIDIYTYGESGLRVAVEYCAEVKQSKEQDAYFAFDNPKLGMITGGVWELDIYPHLPPECKYRPKDVVFTYFIIFDGEVLQCEIIVLNYVFITFIHRKSTPLKDPDTDLIYSPDYDPRPNWRRKITQPTTELENQIVKMWKQDKIFYQDNEVGEIVHNYLKFCKS